MQEIVGRFFSVSPQIDSDFYQSHILELQYPKDTPWDIVTPGRPRSDELSTHQSNTCPTLSRVDPTAFKGSFVFCSNRFVCLVYCFRKTM